MKFLMSLVLFVSVAHARQYIQCGTTDTWDRMVVNLDGDNSTLFLTTGVHLPNELRVLKDLFFVEKFGNFSIYETRDGDVTEIIKLDNLYLDQALSYFPIELTLINDQYENTVEMSCFSSIH